MNIIYEQIDEALQPTFRTLPVGTIMSGTFQGEVSQEVDNTWTATIYDGDGNAEEVVYDFGSKEEWMGRRTNVKLL